LYAPNLLELTIAPVKTRGAKLAATMRFERCQGARAGSCAARTIID
jgi:hypothetical protein